MLPHRDRPDSRVKALGFFNYTNGAGPYGLTLDNDGNFYGATGNGGTNGEYYGTIFKVTPQGVITSLATVNNTTGRRPVTSLTLGNDGAFYSVALNQNPGTVFKVTTNGVLTIVAAFGGTNGTTPLSALTLASDGNFYGTTYDGGDYDAGTVYRVTPDGVLSTLLSFDRTNGFGPQTGLTPGKDGLLYGATISGGIYQQGNLFKITTNGILTMLWSFDGTNGDEPIGEPYLMDDGTIYGTTYGSGISTPYGSVFRLDTNGVLTTLCTFNYTNGAYPRTRLLLGRDGCFYGTTESGGTNSDGIGTVFKVTTQGVLTSLASLGEATGYQPEAGLTQDANGNLYGTTYSGGLNENGTVFVLINPLDLYAIKATPYSITLSGSGPPGATNRIWSSTNVSLSLNQWTPAVTNIADATGYFGFSDTNVLNVSRKFYRVSIP